MSLIRFSNSIPVQVTFDGGSLAQQVARRAWARAPQAPCKRQAWRTAPSACIRLAAPDSASRARPRLGASLRGRGYADGFARSLCGGWLELHHGCILEGVEIGPWVSARCRLQVPPSVPALPHASARRCRCSADLCRWAQTHLHRVCAPRSRTAERAAEYAAQHGCDRTFTSLEELGACPEVDAVYIASPTSEHAKQSILLLGMGKHVLCEKPACSHSTELAAVIAAAEASGKAFMEAMRPLKTPNFDAVKAKLAELGPARHFSGTFCQYSSRWPAYLASTASGGQGEVPNAFLPVSCPILLTVFVESFASVHVIFHDESARGREDRS